MATYCIGDLHGRYDLFQQLLGKIQFDTARDKLYLLGDVIDHNYGGINIFKHILENPTSCFLIQGNHEAQFIYMQEAYDILMCNEQIKKVFKETVYIYSPLFEEISNVFLKKLTQKVIDEVYLSPKVKKWLKSGNINVRTKLLDAMIKLAKTVNLDKDKYEKLYWILSNMNAIYKTKNFVKELLEQNIDTYINILKLCKAAPIKQNLSINGRQFTLSHAIQTCLENRVSSRVLFPHAKTENTYYIFGHTPVPIIHKLIRNDFNFDYKQAFSVIDSNNNYYYNLDLGSSKTNPLVALRLDDLSEFYVGEKELEIPKDRNVYDDTRKFIVDEEGVSDSKHIYITTFKGNSYEYLIGCHEKEQVIVYFRVDLLDLRIKGFTINNWYNNQSVEQIIDKVVEDYNMQLKNPEIEEQYNFLCGVY